MFHALLVLLMMHPVHETVSEVQWNRETQRFEIALRLHILDQQWIENQADKTQKIENVALGYLTKTFRIRPIRDGKAETNKDSKSSKAKIHWVGRSEEGSHVWWYFEVEPVLANGALANEEPKFEIEQRMFFERHEGFHNRVIFIGQLSKTAITLTIERPTAPLEESIDDQPRQPRE